MVLAWEAKEGLIHVDCGGRGSNLEEIREIKDQGVQCNCGEPDMSVYCTCTAVELE